MRGVTLVELVVAIVVIGVALAGVMTVFVRTTSSSADPVLSRQAVAIAEGYLEEVMTKSFVDPDGTESPGGVPESRADYDDVLDYNNLANNGCLTVAQGYTATPACPAPGNCICDQTGQPINGLPGYRANILVTLTALGAVTTSNAVDIQVTVTTPAGSDVVISGFRTSYF
jgi:MSHA pilin protein MshD